MGFKSVNSFLIFLILICYTFPCFFQCMFLLLVSVLLKLSSAEEKLLLIPCFHVQKHVTMFKCLWWSFFAKIVNSVQLKAVNCLRKNLIIDVMKNFVGCKMWFVFVMPEKLLWRPKGLLIHFMPLVFFYTAWKDQKNSCFLRFSGGMERGYWHEIV